MGGKNTKKIPNRNKKASRDSVKRPYTGILLGLGSIGAALFAALLYVLLGNGASQVNPPAQTGQGAVQANTNTGPAVSATWEKAGDIQGEMQTILFDPKDSKVAYLAANGQGVYRSLDGGTTWKLLGPSGKTILDLSIDKSSGRLYAADLGGVLYSDDRGSSWKQVDVGAGEAHAVQVDPRNPKVIWAGFWLKGASGSTLYVSKDGGESFDPVTGGPERFDINFMKFDEESQATYIGTYGGGLFETTDNGKTWRTLNNGLDINTDITLLTWTKDKSVFYVGTHDFGAYRSKDKGASWQAVNTGKESAGDVHGLVVDPSDPNSVYAAGMMMGKGIFKSSNQGDTWQPLQADGINLDDVHVFSINPEGTDIYLGSGEHGEGKGILYRLKV